MVNVLVSTLVRLLDFRSGGDFVMRKSLWMIPVVLLLSALGGTAARADQYKFNISGSGITANGIITVSATGTPRVDDIIGISGTYSDTNSGGFSGSITSLIPCSGSCSASSPTSINLTGLGQIVTFDNLFYPTSAAASCLGLTTAATLDECGVAFYVGSGATDGVNLFGNGGASLVAFDWTSTTIPTSGYANDDAPVTVSFLAVPEPGTSALTLIGLGMLGLMLVFRKRRSIALAQAA